MQDVNVTELRKQLPHYLKLVVHGERIHVTGNGKVPARIVPEDDPAAAARKRLEALRGTMITGDIVAPVEQLKWSGDEDHL